MSEGKRIGFVDYDLENFHANVYLAAFRNELRERGYDVAGCTALMENKGKAWAEKLIARICLSTWLRLCWISSIADCLL